MRWSERPLVEVQPRMADQWLLADPVPRSLTISVAFASGLTAVAGMAVGFVGAVITAVAVLVVMLGACAVVVHYLRGVEAQGWRIPMPRWWLRLFVLGPYSDWDIWRQAEQRRRTR